MTDRWGPTTWGDDALSNFLKEAENNKWASFERLKPEWEACVQINDTHRKAINALGHAENELVVALFARSIGVWRHAVGMAMSGALVEAYSILRLFIEYTLYSSYLRKNPEKMRTWSERDDSESAFKAFKRDKDLHHKNMFEDIRPFVGATIADKMSEVYEKCISFGAHPNVSGLVVNTQIDNSSGTTIAQMICLQADGSKIQAVVRDCVTSGKLSLAALNQCFKRRFELANLDRELDIMNT